MRLFTIFLLSLFSFQVTAQKLSEQAQISVLTVGPGTSLNDAFGHSAFRIKDKTNGLDVVYGYGEYDFDAPNFYLKFAQGKLNYLISKTDFNLFYSAYRYYNRRVDEQILNLNIAQKQALYNTLVENYKPENRKYLYDFFFDNCATKIKDVLDRASENTVKYSLPSNYNPSTFRTLIQENLTKNSWGSLGIDIALGAVIDQYATPEQHMFLPKNIYRFFNVARIENTPLVKRKHTIYEPSQTRTRTQFLYSPIFILGLLSIFILVITYIDFTTHKRTRVLDSTLFFITGLAGLIVLLLWFATDHGATKNNYNLLWANPINLMLCVVFFKRIIGSWITRYLKFLVLLLCLMVFHWVTKVQVFAVGLIPLLIALGVRYLFLIHHFSNNTTAP